MSPQKFSQWLRVMDLFPDLILAQEFPGKSHTYNKADPINRLPEFMQSNAQTL